MAGVLSIANTTRTRLRVSFFRRLHARVLPAYDISLVLATPAAAKKINMHLRKKTYVPNVLSYAVGKRNAEVVLCPQEIKKQSKSFGLSFEECLVYMFIHALLHLKGMRHGDTMERAEQRLLKAVYPLVSIHEKTHSHRH